MKLEEVLMMLCNFVQLGKNLFQQKTIVDIPTLNDGSSSSYMKGPYHSNKYFFPTFGIKKGGNVRPLFSLNLCN